MSILFVRHGETLLNVARTLQPSDTPLSPRGDLQAEAVAQRLAGLGIAGIVSSHLPRARRTAELISKATGLRVNENPALQERNFGSLRGLPYDTLPYNPLAMEDAPPGGESASEFHRRVAEVFAQMVQHRRGLDGHLVVVTHGLVIHSLLTHHLQLPDGTTAPQRLGNTSVTAVSALAPHEVELLDCTLHLADVAQDDAQSLSGG
jgi:2,3-bisphosphoglycerate-dependent phosphoglycerate mutase